MYVTFVELDVGFTCFIDTLQRTDTVVLTAGVDDASSNSRNLTSTEEGVAHVTAIHLHVSNIHTTVVDIAATENTAAIVQTVCTVARPCLVMQFLLVVIITYLYIVEVGICGGYGIKMAIANKAFVHRDMRRTEHGTTLTTTIGVTLDGRNTIDETGTIELTDDDMCLTEDITRRAFADSSSVIAHTTLPATTIDVTCRTALDISIGRGYERIVEIILGYVVFIVHRTHGTSSIEVLRDLTAKESDKGSTMYVAGVRSICITQTTAVGIGTTQTTTVHITADISTLVDSDIGVVFIGSQIIIQTIVGIFVTQ